MGSVGTSWGEAWGIWSVLVWADIPKYHKLGSLETIEIYFFHSGNEEVQDDGTGK